MTSLVRSFLTHLYLAESRFILFLWLPLRLSALLFFTASSEFVAVVFLDSLSLLNLLTYYFGWQSTESQYSQEESIKGKQVFILILPVE